MEAARERKVRSGKEYDYLFPGPTGNDIVIKKSAAVADTVRFIQEQVPRTAWQTEKLARHIRGARLEESCSKLWHFLYNHIRYKRDRYGVEQVRSPRRTWHDREEGVDCDCFSVIISSTLINLGIPHLYRITKYPKRNGETPAWQHIYIVVPKDGNLNRPPDKRSEYIVLDCVKDGYNEEEPYLEKKDFKATMRLDYLDGLEGDMGETEDSYQIPELTDVQDIASVYDEEELGKVGKWLKKTVKKVGTTVKTTAKKVADTAGKGVRFVNRYVNPGTVLLRNGFLLAMKINMLNVAKRLRYAYLSDQQATSLGINLAALARLRKIRERAETIYWQAGGVKENLKKAILGGKGNKDKKVPLNGLFGLGTIYADQDEYDILHSANGIDGLGEVASGAALAAATSALTALAASLKQIKDLFKSGAKNAENFDSDAEEADTSVPEIILPDFEESYNTSLPVATATALPVAPATTTPEVNMEMTTLPVQSETSVTTSVASETAEKTGFFQKAGNWIKANPAKTALIGGVLIAGAVYLRSKKSSGGRSLSGLSGKKKRRKPGRTATSRKKTGKKNSRIRAIKIR